MGAEAAVTQLRRGAVEHCVLALLEDDERYGYDLVQELTAAGLVASEGTVYPLLSRLRKDELVATVWRDSPAGPPRRYYALTRPGQRALDDFRSGRLRRRRRVHPAAQARGPTSPPLSSILRRKRGGTMTTAPAPARRGLPAGDCGPRRPGCRSTRPASWSPTSTSTCARRSRATPSEAEVRNVLERLGAPDELVSRGRRDAPAAGSGTQGSFASPGGAIGCLVVAEVLFICSAARTACCGSSAW